MYGIVLSLFPITIILIIRGLFVHFRPWLKHVLSSCCHQMTLASIPLHCFPILIRFDTNRINSSRTNCRRVFVKTPLLPLKTMFTCSSFRLHNGRPSVKKPPSTHTHACVEPIIWWEKLKWSCTHTSLSSVHIQSSGSAESTTRQTIAGQEYYLALTAITWKYDICCCCWQSGESIKKWWACATGLISISVLTYAASTMTRG